MKTGLFIGRFQPFHEGHAKCVQHILAENDRCIILLRNTNPSDKNPFDAAKRKALIRMQFKNDERIVIREIDDPDADLTVYIGRDVGYDLIRLDAASEAISATDIRKSLYESTKKIPTTS